MRANQLAWLGIAGLVFTSGCIPSLHPIYTESDLVTRAPIVGRWTDTGGTQTWQFRQTDADGYELVYTHKDGRSGHFAVHLTEIGDALFMDLFPIRSDHSAPDFFNLHVVAVHTFFRVDLADDTLGLSFLNPEWLKQHRNQLADALPYAQRDDNSVLLTADTGQLRGFIAQHLESHGAFTDPFALNRVADQ